MASHYKVRDDGGYLLNARIDLEQTTQGWNVIFASRSGARGSPQMRNPDYVPAVRTVLSRIADGPVGLSSIDLVSRKALRDLDDAERHLLGPDAFKDGVEAAYDVLSRRMEKAGRDPASSSSGNRNKRISMSLLTDLSESAVASLLGLVPNDSAGLTASQMTNVGADHIRAAVLRLEAGEGAGRAGRPSDFDLISDTGSRLVPEEVFCLAATLAPGVTIGADELTGSEGSLLHRALREAGYKIVRKNYPADPEPRDSVLEGLLQDEDRRWAEGSRKARNHLANERAAGLGKAKRADFLRRHGRLFCERCGFDPVASFGEKATSCIEVHHIHPLGDDTVERHTSLEDVECVCANCHRLIHRFLRDGISVPSSIVWNTG